MLSDSFRCSRNCWTAGVPIAWDAGVAGMSSIALLAASATSNDPIAASMVGGHGELFVQQFDGQTLAAQCELKNLPPTEAAKAIDAELVVGSGAQQLVET